MKKSWYENFLHENFIFMGENEFSINENENLAQNCSWVKIPCIKLCTAQLSMQISTLKISINIEKYYCFNKSFFNIYE